MKHDIRDLFKQNIFSKKKLPASHREDFFKKLQESEVVKPTNKWSYAKLKVAISIAALIAVILMLQKEKENINNPEHVVYEKNDIENTTETLKKEISGKSKIVFQIDTSQQEFNDVINPIINKEPEIATTEKVAINNTAILEEINEIDTLHIASNKGRIKVNSDALLYSITHTREEVLAYYKENNLIRASVIKDIEFQLKESRLAINAEDLLIEIESVLNKKSFKEKLIAKIELKIKELSVAMATN